MVAVIPSLFGIFVYNDKISSGKVSQNICFNNEDIYWKLVIFQLFNSYDIMCGLKSDSTEDFLRDEILLILSECLVIDIQWQVGVVELFIGVTIAWKLTKRMFRFESLKKNCIRKKIYFWTITNFRWRLKVSESRNVLTRSYSFIIHRESSQASRLFCKVNKRYYFSFPFLYILDLLFPETIIIVESKSRIYSKKNLVTSFFPHKNV